MDEADHANDYAEHFTAEAIRRARQPPLATRCTGFCLNPECAKQLIKPTALFCGISCSEVWGRYRTSGRL